MVLFFINFPQTEKLFFLNSLTNVVISKQIPYKTRLLQQSSTAGEVGYLGFSFNPVTHKIELISKFKMQSRLVAIDEGKNSPIRANQPRVLPQRLLQFLLVFLGLGILFSIVSIYMTRYFGIQNEVPVAVTQSKVLPCFQEQNSLQKWIRTPSNLLHQMNDSQLFWRASFVPQIREYPFKRVHKIAFMFLTRGPMPLSPLWDRFFKGHEERYSIYIHSLPSYEPDFPPSSVFYRKQIPSQVAKWGKVSMCDAERRLLANALLDISNEWFVLLSEACIPLHNFSIIYQYLSRSRFSFMQAIDDPGPYGRGCYNDSMFPDVNITQWRKGSQWFQVNRKLAVDIITDTLYYPKFKKYSRRRCYIDELYFSTMLTMMSPQLLANRSVTWADWSKVGPHPATFGEADMNDEFFKRITEGQTCIYNKQPSSLCFLFARKFAPNALDPLLENSSKFFGF